jgi:hypothetical protein
MFYHAEGGTLRNLVTWFGLLVLVSTMGCQGGTGSSKVRGSLFIADGEGVWEISLPATKPQLVLRQNWVSDLYDVWDGFLLYRKDVTYIAAWEIIGSSASEVLYRSPHGDYVYDAKFRPEHRNEIAYIRGNGPQFVYLVDAEKATERELAELPENLHIAMAGDTGPPHKLCWDPNGDLLYVCTTVDSGWRGDLVELNVTTGEWSILGNGWYPVYTLETGEVLVIDERRLIAVNPETKQTRVVRRTRFFEPFENIAGVAPSPDGKLICIARLKDPVFPDRTEMLIVDVIDGAVKNEFTVNGHTKGVAWGP